MTDTMSRHKFTTSICAIVKNEGRYIAEWLSFHKAIGIDHIFIYDNESDDNTRDILQSYILEGFVTAVQWPSNKNSNPQRLAYQNFLDIFSQCTKWVIYLDADEFINLKEHSSVDEFLSRYEQFSGVAINWRMFGDGGNNKYHPDLLITRFRTASESNFFANKLVKTFVKVRDMEHPDIHNPKMLDARITVTTKNISVEPFPVSHTEAIDHDIAQINHYFVKSIEEWSIKRLRGKADAAHDAEDRFRPDGEFSVYNRNEELEESILRWKDAVLDDLSRRGLHQGKQVEELPK